MIGLRNLVDPAGLLKLARTVVMRLSRSFVGLGFHEEAQLRADGAGARSSPRRSTPSKAPSPSSPLASQGGNLRDDSFLSGQLSQPQYPILEIAIGHCRQVGAREGWLEAHRPGLPRGIPHTHVKARLRRHGCLPLQPLAPHQNRQNRQTNCKGATVTAVVAPLAASLPEETASRPLSCWHFRPLAYRGHSGRPALPRLYTQAKGRGEELKKPLKPLFPAQKQLQPDISNCMLS